MTIDGDKEGRARKRRTFVEIEVSRITVSLHTSRPLIILFHSDQTMIQGRAENTEHLLIQTYT